MHDPTGTPTPETVYENTADEAWARQALDLYRRRQLQVQAFSEEGVISAQIWGTCPRCGHELNLQLTLSTPIAGLREGRGLLTALTRRNGSPGVPDAVDVGCGCGHAHPGAPGQVTGCGVSFRLPTSPPDTLRPSR